MMIKKSNVNMRLFDFEAKTFLPNEKFLEGCKQAHDLDSGLFLPLMCIYMYHYDKHWSFSII